MKSWFKRWSHHAVGLLLLTAQPAFAQLTLDSVSPADGAVTVATNTSVELTFNSPLDTTVFFHDRHIKFLDIEIMPEDSVHGPAIVTVSSDLKTVSIADLQLTPDTKFMVFLTKAQNTAGEQLAHPYVSTFATGDVLGAGQVNGEVTFSGDDAAGAVVGLFGRGLFEDDVQAIGVVNSPYSINYVEDGVYYPVSVKDTNGDDGIRLERGDALGFYDPNNDGIADTINVVNGDTVNNVDIAISEPAAGTATEDIPLVEAAAVQWASDAHLIALESGNIFPEGEAYHWAYIMYSPSSDAFQAFSTFGDFVVPMELGRKDNEDGMNLPPDTTALPLNWIDSDSAMAVALRAGGHDFLDKHFDVEMFAGLHNDHGGPPPDDSSGMAPGPFQQLAGFAPFKKARNWQVKDATLAAANDMEPHTIWNVFFWSEQGNDFFDVAIDAITGELLFSSVPHAARERLDSIAHVPESWAGDAMLVEVSSYDIGPDGKSHEWRFSFFSPSKDSVLHVDTHDSDFHREVNDRYSVPSIEPLPGDWLDSPEAAAIAEGNSDDFRARHPNHWVSAYLKHWDMGEPTRAVWYFVYESHDGQPERKEIRIDASTGELIHVGGPISLISSSPADGSVNVPATIDFELVFSAPLDTNFYVHDGEFLGMKVFPKDSVGKPTSREISTDLKTVTYRGVTLTPNTQFTVLLTEAASMAYEPLDHPYIITFTTSNSLAQGTVLGEIEERPDFYPWGTPVFLFKKNAFYDEVAGVGVAHSPYEIHHVPDGSFLPVAVTHYDGPMFGFYDPDENSIPDTIHVSSGSKREHVDLKFIEGERQTARDPLTDIEAAIQTWATDARLVGVAGENVDPEGESPNWVYLYYSPVRDEFQGIFEVSGVVLAADTQMGYRDTTGLPFEWIDSDTVAAIASRNGAAEFREKHGQIQSYANLNLEYHDQPGNPLLQMTIGDVPIYKGPHEFAKLPAELFAQRTLIPVWYIGMWSYDTGDFFDIAIDAVTGEVLRVSGPLTLIGSSPAHGSANVSTLIDFELTFSAPLDTNFYFGADGHSFLDIEFHPRSAASKPAKIDVSADLRTVTYHGVTLQDDTQFTVLLSDAVSTSYQHLDHPYFITFTTGDALPTGAVSGNVVDDEQQSARSGNVPVFLFKQNTFYDQIAGMTFASSTARYEIDFVPDGSFLPVAFGYEERPRFGFFDPNMDGVPDTVHVDNGGKREGVELKFFEGQAKTAREPFNAIETAISTWADDARLITVGSDGVGPEGKAPNWVYLFYSPSLNSFQGIFEIGGVIFAANTEEVFHDTTGVPATWIDSDSAAAIVNANGGGAFRERNGKVHVFASLHVDYHDSPMDSLPPMRVGNVPVFKQPRKFAKLPKAAFARQTVIPVWYFNFYAEETGSFFDIAINAITGEVIFSNAPSTARQRLPVALEFALGWAADAELINLHTFNVASDGHAENWFYSFVSSRTDSVLIVNVYGGSMAFAEFRDSEEPPSRIPLPSEWIDCPQAAHEAWQIANELLRDLDPFNFSVEVILSRGMQDNEKALWMFKFIRFDTQEEFTVAIDALTGVPVISSVETNDPDLPGDFSLSQNFPNPFNPETVIKYQLAQEGDVELTVFNILGQHVRSLVTKVQPAGFYEVRWDGRNDRGVPVTSGIYIYRLKTQQYVKTRKMLFIR